MDFASDPTGSLERIVASHGDVAEVRFLRRQAFLLSHPDLIQDVLVTNSRLFVKGEGLQRAKRVLGEGLLTSEGDFHLRQRRLLQPLFLRSRIQGYAEAMVHHAAKVSARWEDGAEVDMAVQMNRLTLAVVGETLFSADVEGEAGEVGEALDTTLEMFDALSSPLAPLLERLPFGPLNGFRQARARLDATIFRLVEERAQTDHPSQDLLAVLLAARYDDGSAMTREQIRDEAMTIFLAGHETTANALAWTWLLLAQHPEVAKRLHDETVSVLGDRAATMEDVENLTYARQVISESMRLYPPAWIIGRTALTDYILNHEDERYVVPRGSTVAVSQWIMHRDPRYWHNADRFDPDRWASPNPNRPKFAYFPFGAGPRQCIGEGFAWMEAILLLATLARDWRAELRQEPPGLQPRITLRPEGGIRMQLHRW